MKDKPEVFTVAYGTSFIDFVLTRSKRKTLAIHVHPDTSVGVVAPEAAPIELIKAKVQKRAKWIRKQQNQFGRFPPALPMRRYISGETFTYLGKQYLLRTEKDLACSVKIDKQNILVTAPILHPSKIKLLVDAWFRKRAEAIFTSRLSLCAQKTKRFGVEFEGDFSLKSMKTRWGSCTRNGRITLNPELVCASRNCIDYVLFHELCHLKVHNHGSAFYKLLNAVCPSWKTDKEKLETSMELRGH